MQKKSVKTGGYTANHVDYPRSEGIDKVCQIKKFGIEICHCTWHPDGAVHCKDRKNNNFDYPACPMYGSDVCLRQ